MGLDLQQFVTYVIRPALHYWEPEIPYSLAAERLLVATALHESGGLVYIDQREKGPERPGPALGIFQIEPATHRDLYVHWLRYRPSWEAKLRALLAPGRSELEQLRTNFDYAAAWTRVNYYRHPAPLPHADDIEGLGWYAKRHHNSSAGKATADDYAFALRHAVRAYA